MTPAQSCDLCGCIIVGHATFALGRVWCASCFVEEPPKAMPPNAHEQAQLALWLETPTERNPMTPIPPKADTPNPEYSTCAKCGMVTIRRPPPGQPALCLPCHRQAENKKRPSGVGLASND